MKNPAGLYLHIPFCESKCAYCDFYSQATSKVAYKAAHKELLQHYVDALCREIADSQDFLPQPAQIATLYFGGGTPSLLQAAHFEQIFQVLSQHFDLSQCQEITLEANPDDLSDAYLESLRHLPFNRLSIGIQSFQDEELAFIGRRHNAQEAIAAVQAARKAGFDNISIDLMMGLPKQNLASLSQNIEQAIALQSEHISAYFLSLEPEVPLSKSLQEGRWQECDENTAEAMYQVLCDQLRAAGYEHYEISNFAKAGRRSQHNASYWQGRPYLGFGPSAHSYNGRIRRWNGAHLSAYIQGDYQREEEVLSLNDAYNDFILTRLRTSEGIHLQELRSTFGQNLYEDCLRQAKIFMNSGDVLIEDECLRIAPPAYFVSDNIIRELFVV